MKFQLSNRRVLVTTQGPAEYTSLSKFPGLLKDGPYFFIPAEPRLVYNLLARIKTKWPNKELELDEGTYRLYSAPFKLKELPASFKFYTKPKDFQEIALRYVYTVGGGGLLLEPGMGKTKVVLDFIALMGFNKVIIVCPKPLLFVWEDEQAIHRPDKSIYAIRSTDWEKEVEHVEKAEIVVINYNKAVTLKEELVKLKPQFIGVDEALIKDPMSDRTEALTWISKHVPHRMLMSGTLVNNSCLDVFAPVRFLEPSLVGWSYTNFKDEYTVQAGKPPSRFVVGYRRVEEVKSILETTSIVMTKDEWLKLPQKKFMQHFVQPSDEQRTAYLGLQSNYIVDIQGTTIEISNPLTALTKLIQIANGFVYVSAEPNLDELDGETPLKKAPRETLFFKEQPKLEKLIELLKTELKGKRCIVWFNMQAEYKIISERLENEQIKFLSIRGGERDVGAKVRSFNTDLGYQVLLCQAKSVNYGVTVLGRDGEDSDMEQYPSVDSKVFTQVFYSLNFSLEVFLQQQDRTHRLGQEHECEYHILLTNVEAERHVMNKIQEKQSIRGQVLEDVIKKLGFKTATGHWCLNDEEDSDGNYKWYK
jgi:SNF2 family DNA or RNA helicase